MPNTSATGGVLVPDPAGPEPLEGQALNRFLQQWISGVCTLDGTLVRPRYQAEPPDIPDAAVAWAAVGYGERRADMFPAIVHRDGYDQLQRHQEMDVLCSFYDLGTNGLADFYAGLLRDGLSIPQNLELLTLNGFALVSADDTETVPSLLKSRWLYRVDITLTLRREILRNYPVLNLSEAVASVETDASIRVGVVANLS